MKTALIIISTPFHLFNAWNIISNMSDIIFDVCYSGNTINEDIYILNSLKNVNMILILNNHLKYQNYFYLNSIMLLISIFICKHEYKNSYLSRCNYNKIFISYPNIFNRVIVSNILNNNPNISISMFEDGIGTYCSIDKTRKKITKYIYKILIGKDIYEIIDDIYCYRPELISNYKYNIIKIKFVKCDFINSYLYNYYKNKYRKQIDLYRECAMIIFDQCAQLNNKNIINKEFKLFKYIVSIFEGHVVIKLHPRAIKNYYFDNLIISYDVIPFEILLLFLDNIEKLVLVSIESTACFTPITIFGIEPYVIFLKKIFSNGKNIDDKLFDILRFYNDETKYFIPDTLNELKSIFKNLIYISDKTIVP